MPNDSLRALSTIIPNGTAISGVIDLGSALGPNGFFIPNPFTGATISFLACATQAGIYVPVQNAAGALIVLTVTPGTYVGIDPLLLQGIRYIKILSASNEAADRVIGIATKQAR